jgi:hypothetical protein
MKKIIRLAESDLTRIVRRVIKEQGDATEPQKCRRDDVLRVKSDLKTGSNSFPFRVENAKSFDNKDYKNVLVITTPYGVCHCKPSEFFG